MLIPVSDDSESFAEYLIRVKVILGSAVFVIMSFYLILLRYIDIGFFYGRMYGDPLHYFYRAANFIQYGNGNARYAENALPMIDCVSLPSYLRLPAFLLADSFDGRLRLIQLSNIVIVVLLGILFSYYLSKVLPRKCSGWAIAFSFLFLMVCGFWQKNVFLPLVDSFFALSTISAILIMRSIGSLTPISRQKMWQLTLVLLLITVSFLLKITGLLLVLYFLAHFYEDIAIKTRSNSKLPIIVAFIAAIFSVAMVWVNYTMILFYVNAGIYRMQISKPLDWVLNFAARALPSQILPNYNYYYSRGSNTFVTFHWFSNVQDVILLIVGLIITCIILMGIWRSRKTHLPEIIYLLSVIPIIAPIMTSTDRYLGPYQPLIWLFFYNGIAIQKREVVGEASSKASSYRLFIVACMVAALFFGTRVYGLMKVSGDKYYKVSGMIKDVSSVNSALRDFLSSLNPERTRLLYTGGDDGKWRVIVGLKYYAPDENLSAIVSRYDTYIVVDREVRFRRDYNAAVKNAFISLEQFGKFRIYPVFEQDNQYAKATVLRVVFADQ